MITLVGPPFVCVQVRGTTVTRTLLIDKASVDFPTSVDFPINTSGGVLFRGQNTMVAFDLAECKDDDHLVWHVTDHQRKRGQPREYWWTREGAEPLRASRPEASKRVQTRGRGKGQDCAAEKGRTRQWRGQRPVVA